MRSSGCSYKHRSRQERQPELIYEFQKSQAFEVYPGSFTGYAIKP